MYCYIFTYLTPIMGKEIDYAPSAPLVYVLFHILHIFLSMSQLSDLLSTSLEGVYKVDKTAKKSVHCIMLDR